MLDDRVEPRRFAVALLLVFASCNGFFYYPDTRLFRERASLGPDVEDVTFASGDGTRLHAWFLHARGERLGTIVFFHGNAHNLTRHAGSVDWLPARGFDVFLFDYRGYGESAGTPSRGGIHLDCLAALDHVRHRPDVDPDRLLVFGQSLGGAVAIAALGDGGADGVCGVAVDSTFASYVGMGNAVLGGTFLTWPFAWLLLSDAHSPIDVVDRLAPVPLLVVASPLDSHVPISQGRELFDAAREPKQFVELPEDGHPVATSSAAGRERLVEFFTACLPPRRPPG